MTENEWKKFTLKLKRDLEFIDRNTLTESQIITYNDLSKGIDEMSREKGAFEKAVTEMVSRFLGKHKGAAIVLIVSMLAGGSFVSFDQLTGGSGGASNVAAAEILEDHTHDLREIHVVLSQHSKILAEVVMYIKKSTEVSQKILIQQERMATIQEGLKEDIRYIKYKK